MELFSIGNEYLLEKINVIDFTNIGIGQTNTLFLSFQWFPIKPLVI